MNAEMSLEALEAAYRAPYAEPDLDELLGVYNRAIMGTAGDVDSALAAVNELLGAPLAFEEFIALYDGSDEA